MNSFSTFLTCFPLIIGQIISIKIHYFTFVLLSQFSHFHQVLKTTIVIQAEIDVHQCIPRILLYHLSIGG